ncbi:hypothetical protein BH23PSE1_BH23PSE1_19240 [soil metagenome]
MRVDPRLGSFEEIAGRVPEHAATLDALREIVARLHPEAIETASRKQRNVTWGWGGARMSEAYAYAMAHKSHVNLGFFQGIHLPDPAGLLEGTGKVLRHVKIETPEDARRPAILDLLSAARDERRRALNLD